MSTTAQVLTPAGSTRRRCISSTSCMTDALPAIWSISSFVASELGRGPAPHQITDRRSGRQLPVSKLECSMPARPINRSCVTASPTPRRGRDALSCLPLSATGAPCGTACFHRAYRLRCLLCRRGRRRSLIGGQARDRRRGRRVLFDVLLHRAYLRRLGHADVHRAETCAGCGCGKSNMNKDLAVGREVRGSACRCHATGGTTFDKTKPLDLGGTDARWQIARQNTCRSICDIEVRFGSPPRSVWPPTNIWQVASRLEKPRGYSVIGKAEALTFLVSRLLAHLGRGRAMQGTLEKDGIRAIGQLQKMESDLLCRYGSMVVAHHLSRGEDIRVVSTDDTSKSIGFCTVTSFIQ